MKVASIIAEPVSDVCSTATRGLHERLWHRGRIPLIPCGRLDLLHFKGKQRLAKRAFRIVSCNVVSGSNGIAVHGTFKHRHAIGQVKPECLLRTKMCAADFIMLI